MKFKRNPIRSTPSGNEVSIPTYFFAGKDTEAKSVSIQASIHGAELQGNSVIFHLSEFFKKNPPLGNVTLVTCANPTGMDRKTSDYTDGRFDPTTGENWNRAYFMPVIENESKRTDPLQLSVESLPAGISREDLKFRLNQAIRNRKKSSIRYAEKLALTLQGMPSQAAIPPVFRGALDEAISEPWAILNKKYAWPPHAIPQSYRLELGSQDRVSDAEGLDRSIRQ